MADNATRNLVYFLDKHNSILNKILEQVCAVNKTLYDTSMIYNLYCDDITIQYSIMPSIDILFHIKYPNSNTYIHIPKDHQAYIDYNLEMSRTLNLVNTIYKNHNATFSLLKNINVVRIFRKKYWHLSTTYINKYSF